MDCIRAYKFRIYPDEKRREAIDNTLVLSQQLYNALLDKTIETHKNNPNSKISQRVINQLMQNILKVDKRYYALYSHVRVDIRNRILRTYQNFFRRCKEKKAGKVIKVGFPRFKSRDKYKSIMHIENNGSFSIEKGGLRISKIGKIKIEIHRSIEGKIKTLMIKKEAGKFYAIFTAIKEIKQTKIKDVNPIGIDMGLNSFIAMSDGTKIQKPKFLQEKKKRLARWQRIVARRKKGSKRRARAKLKLQKEWAYVANESDDFAHKLSNKMVNLDHTSFAVENLNIQNIMKNHNLAQSIHNAAWNKFVRLLSYKAESAGMVVIEVNPKDTTKKCSNCGNMQSMPLSERTYNCNRCGLQMDRDINASINILKRAREGHSQSYAQGDSVRPQLGAVVEELRTYPATQSVHVGEASNL